jgi:tetratricopeptide (TPR) repeat protein
MLEVLSPQQLAQTGESQYQAGQYEEAASSFEKAAKSYLNISDPLMAAEMANNLSVALLRAGHSDKAYEACLGTDQIFAQAGDNRRRAIALGNQASALEALGQKEQALDLYQQCSDLLKQENLPELRSAVLKSISALQLRTGRQFEAMASMDAAINTKKHLSLRERFLQMLIKLPFRLMR